MADRIELTTPLYYVNAAPHLGHTYTTVVVDTLARFHRSMGRDVFFLTGTDEHGDKIAQAAEAGGKAPREYADDVSALFRSTWNTCGIAYDHFVRTTDDYHVAFVREVLQKVYDAGDIYFGEYGGQYCTGCERFYTDRELVDGKCPDHQTVPQWIREENYFFRMSRYQQALLDHLEGNPDLIVPAGYRNEVLGLLREPIGDLCISRPKSRLTWGIELPFDDRYVCYVWFDALINYVSALRHAKGEGWERYWRCARHFIAKDILKPHAVFWPTMLMAAGLPVYERLYVHGYWNMGESKMSKSLGNVIRPLEMRERFGMDGFRYFLLREMAFGSDASFTEDAFVTRFNADLSNGAGNLVSRVLSMQHKYFDGRIQPIGEETERAADVALEQAFLEAEKRAVAALEKAAFHVALEEIWKAVAACDKYVVETSPFKLWKDERERPRVGAILHVLCDALRHLARLIAPFMPETSAAIAGLLRADPGQLAEAPAPWRRTFRAGHQVGEPQPLFPRIEVPKA
ncbi:MAG TPA: methionine--tRNA ligase [Candidatus Limnocylindrales bacterium]|nr:methionine--tRNA ligase [Candidatus Limnocylindrales bacterium]